MSIAKPFTFTANTYAKASEVNADFDIVYSQVNTNISAIAQNATDIDNLENNKANINGNTSQRFAVADAVTNGDAINKQTLFKAIGNTLDYISGLAISKDNGSPDDTIIVSAGSAYDSTKTVVLSLGSSTSKQNLNQAASAIYYVYIIGNSTGSLIDILISTSSTTPALPTGYSLFRQIGYYTTNSDNEIDSIGYYGEGLNSDKSAYSIMGAIMPDYTARVSVALGTDYTCPSDGFIIARAASVNHTPSLIYINSTGYEMSNSSGGYIDTAMFNGFVSKGDVINLSNSSQGGLSGYLWFIPLKGVTNA